MQVNPITAVTVNKTLDSSGAIIVTSSNHGLTTDETVTITGVLGDTAANGEWKVKVLNANQYSLYAMSGPNPSTGTGIPSVANGVYAGGGTWTNNFLSVNGVGLTDPVLANLFITSPATPTIFSSVITADLLAIPLPGGGTLDLAGKTVRIRIASADNQGPLIVAVDNVALNVKFNNSIAPTLKNLAISNPSLIGAGGFNSIQVTQGGAGYISPPTVLFSGGGGSGAAGVAVIANGSVTGVNITSLGSGYTSSPSISFSGGGGAGAAAIAGIPYTNDPTITGAIESPFGLSAISYIAFDPTNGNFTGPTVVKTTQWDADGNFSFTLPNAPAGLDTVGVEVVDRAPAMCTRPRLNSSCKPPASPNGNRSDRKGSTLPIRGSATPRFLVASRPPSPIVWTRRATPIWSAASTAASGAPPTAATTGWRPPTTS